MRKFETTVRNIVFLVCWPITGNEARKFGFDYLREQGFNVLVFDIWPLTNRKALEASPVPEALVGEEIVVFNNYRDYGAALERYAENSVFIDYMLALADIDLRYEKAYRLIKKYDLICYVISAGALPIGGGSFSRRRWQLLKKAFNPAKVADFLIRRGIRWLQDRWSLYPTPSVIFATASDIVARYASLHGLSSHRIKPIHSLDYDAYLRFRRSSESPPVEEPYVVFLDEAMTHHPDFFILGLQAMEPEAYYSSMNRLFEKIEETVGVPVIVAAHPKSKYEGMANPYGDRKIIKGSTVALVANCRMAVTHASTSVNFAVIADKPLLLVETDEMIKTSFAQGCERMAESLGVPLLNIDDPVAFASFDFDPATWRRTNYESYKYKHTQSRGLPDLTIWEFVTLHIREMHPLV